jgi:hypothetical protein
MITNKNSQNVKINDILKESSRPLTSATFRETILTSG